MREVFRRAAQRYRAWSNFYYYSRGKLALDPAYPVVAKLLTDSGRPVMDLGCGTGLLAVCLRENGHRERITGIDVDAEKIGVANQVLGAENAEFLVLDARKFPGHSGDVVMLDALHYFSDEEQQALLRRIGDAVAPGGMAVIRMAVKEANWRYALTEIEEWLVKLTKWIPAAGWNFPTREEIIEPFRAAGFDVECRPMWGWTPFNSYLFVFRRKG